MIHESKNSMVSLEAGSKDIADFLVLTRKFKQNLGIIYLSSCTNS